MKHHYPSECVKVPINVKPEPDLEPYCLSHELESRESAISLHNHDMKFKAKSELCTDEHLS